MSGLENDCIWVFTRKNGLATHPPMVPPSAPQKKHNEIEERPWLVRVHPNVEAVSNMPKLWKKFYSEILNVAVAEHTGWNSRRPESRELAQVLFGDHGCRHVCPPDRRRAKRHDRFSHFFLVLRVRLAVEGAFLLPENAKFYVDIRKQCAMNFSIFHLKGICEYAGSNSGQSSQKIVRILNILHDSSTQIYGFLFLQKILNDILAHFLLITTPSRALTMFWKCE